MQFVCGGKDSEDWARPLTSNALLSSPTPNQYLQGESFILRATQRRTGFQTWQRQQMLQAVHPKFGLAHPVSNRSLARPF